MSYVLVVLHQGGVLASKVVIKGGQVFGANEATAIFIVEVETELEQVFRGSLVQFDFDVVNQVLVVDRGAVQV